jgi:hypothetical protein
MVVAGGGGGAAGGGSAADGDELPDEQAARTHPAAAKVTQDIVRFICRSPYR